MHCHCRAGPHRQHAVIQGYGFSSEEGGGGQGPITTPSLRSAAPLPTLHLRNGMLVGGPMSFCHVAWLESSNTRRSNTVCPPRARQSEECGPLKRPEATDILTHMHTYIHSSIHACIHTCIHACMHKYIRTYMRTDIHTYIHSSMHTHIHAHIHKCIHTYRHTYTLHTRMHVCIHMCAFIHTYMRADRQTHVHTPIHSFIHV